MLPGPVGKGAAMAAAIAAADTQWVCFLDADPTSSQTNVPATLRHAAASGNADHVIGDYEYADPGTILASTFTIYEPLVAEFFPEVGALGANSLTGYRAIRRRYGRGTFEVQSTAWSKGLRITADGTGVASQVGGVLLRMLADRAGLTGQLSGALARRGWWPGHDRGRVLTDLAVMIAGGGEAIADIDVLRRRSGSGGSTCWTLLSRCGHLSIPAAEPARASCEVLIVREPSCSSR